MKTLLRNYRSHDAFDITSLIFAFFNLILFLFSLVVLSPLIVSSTQDYLSNGVDNTFNTYILIASCIVISAFISLVILSSLLLVFQNKKLNFIFINLIWLISLAINFIFFVSNTFKGGLFFSFASYASASFINYVLYILCYLFKDDKRRWYDYLLMIIGGFILGLATSYRDFVGFQLIVMELSTNKYDFLNPGYFFRIVITTLTYGSISYFYLSNFKKISTLNAILISATFALIALALSAYNIFYPPWLYLIGFAFSYASFFLIIFFPLVIHRFITKRQNKTTQLAIAEQVK